MRAHLAYLKYVLRHKWFVLQACRDTGTSLWRGLLHDWSKFLPAEWTPYVHSFYNSDGTSRKGERPSSDFDAAWNHHQKIQPHHWQYWILLCDDGSWRPLPMPEEYVREMVADWMGAGRAITGNWLDLFVWYERNRSKMVLHSKTRKLVETLLDQFRHEVLRGVLSQMEEGKSVRLSSIPRGA